MQNSTVHFYQTWLFFAATTGYYMIRVATTFGITGNTAVCFAMMFLLLLFNIFYSLLDEITIRQTFLHTETIREMRDSLHTILEVLVKFALPLEYLPFLILGISRRYSHQERKLTYVF